MGDSDLVLAALLGLVADGPVPLVLVAALPALGRLQEQHEQQHGPQNTADQTPHRRGCAPGRH